MSEHRRISVLFVCTGNICRSPTAEAVFKHCVREAGLAGRIASDSAGTHDYHVGEPPDPRTQAAAKQRGYDLGELRARRLRREDFERFDYVLAMDEANLRLLERLCPREHAHKLKLLRDFALRPRVEIQQQLELVRMLARGLNAKSRTPITGARKTSSGYLTWWRRRRRVCCATSIAMTSPGHRVCPGRRCSLRYRRGRSRSAREVLRRPLAAPGERASGAAQPADSPPPVPPN